MPRGTQVPAASFSGSGTGLSPALARLSSLLPLPTRESLMPVLQPRTDESARFGLFPLRSPLLRESRLISFPSGTEMFHFPELAPCRLCIHLQATGHDSRRVSPFRNPRIKGCLAPPRGLSQLTASFIAFRRQGIHPMLLFACFSKKTPFHPYAIVKEPTLPGPPSSALGSHSRDLCVTRLLPNVAWRKVCLMWWSWTGLNRRPPACKADALPAELQPLGQRQKSVPEQKILRKFPLWAAGSRPLTQR